MKKLMIALAAAAAITGVAKATGVNHVTNFELLGNGAAFNATMAEDGTDDGDKYWAIETGATGPYAVVTNFEGGTGTYTNDSTRALSIDTDKLLSRKVNPNSDGAEAFTSEAPLYFDGYVQFTAADSLPETDEADKLVVWLYGGDESTDGDVLTGLGLTEQTKVATNLVVTAGVVDPESGDPTKTHFLIEGLTIAPNSWHRLTIKTVIEAVGDFSVPGFKVWVDENPVESTSGAKTFFSLVKHSVSGAKTLTSVSFKGTGAVDDLGFLDDDNAPDFAKDVVVETFTLTVTAPGGEIGIYEDEENTPSKKLSPASAGTYLVPQTWEYAYVSFALAEGYTFEGATYNGTPIQPDESSEGSDYYFTLPNTADGAFVITTSGGGSSGDDWPADPTEVAGTTAAEAFGITGDLAAADAGALATWAKANGVNYANKTDILTDAFLLNCANTAVAVAAAKEEFKVTSISVAADGTVTITPADGAKYGNGKVVVEGSTALPASWHNKTDGDYFFRVKLVVDEVPVN